MIVSPSILVCDYLHLESELEKIKSVGCPWIHLDVMDGHFVPNISFGNIFFEKLFKNLDFVKDVHLMVTDPMSFVKKFAKTGADYLTFHYEACKDDDEVDAIIDEIHKYKMKAGLSIKPSTPVEKVFPFLEKLDLVLIMSVEPGAGGQKFIPETLDKISALIDEIVEVRSKALISVDGGINDITGKDCLNIGADVLVAGNYLFSAENFKERYESLFK
ncbi:MAG: ribulose-phosphate 3-epimerase [Bacilli bacterium]|nr:ribulose-phosphate 3-epimerase [Bacilli bacterium]